MCRGLEGRSHKPGQNPGPGLEKSREVSLVHDIRREEMIRIDYFLGTQDFAYERGRDEADARGLAAVGKLTEIVEVENETWQGAKFGEC